MTHLASITNSQQVGPLMRAINGFDVHAVTRAALRLALQVFVRPGELRHAEWLEIDFDKALWSIPAEKMKMRRPHRVPLSRQSLAILFSIREVTGTGKYVFPGFQSIKRPMSENALNGALRRLGHSGDEMTSHGFRAMASTLLIRWASGIPMQSNASWRTPRRTRLGALMRAENIGMSE